MTDAHTPRLLSDADAAADLAGVARPVSLPEPSFRLVWLADRGVYKVNKPNIDTTDCYTPDVVRTLVSERDALASRVRELEADAARWRRLVNASEMPFPPATVANDPENDATMLYGRKRLERYIDDLDEIPSVYAALSTTPESKP